MQIISFQGGKNQPKADAAKAKSNQPLNQTSHAPHPQAKKPLTADVFQRTKK